MGAPLVGAAASPNTLAPSPGIPPLSDCAAPSSAGRIGAIDSLISCLWSCARGLSTVRRGAPGSVEGSIAFWRLRNHDDHAVGDGKALAILLEVVADYFALRDVDVLVDDCAANPRVTADTAVVHHHRVVDLAVR